MAITRRKLMKMAGLGAGSLMLPFGGMNFAAAQQAGAATKKLVVVYLRFGADAMYMVSPTASSLASVTNATDFYMRTDSSVAKQKDGLGRGEFFKGLDVNGADPDVTGLAIDSLEYRNIQKVGDEIQYTTDATLSELGLPLTNMDDVTNTDFVLHPAMGKFSDLYKQNKLAIIHGVGGQGSHSHFAAQDATEWAYPDDSKDGTRNGWLGEIITNDADADVTPFTGVSLTSALAEAFSSTKPLGDRTSAVASLAGFDHKDIASMGEDSYKNLLTALYPPVGAQFEDFPALKNQGDALFKAIDLVKDFTYSPTIDFWDDLKNGGAVDGFYEDLRDAVAIIQSDNTKVRCVNVDAGLGWDTHKNQVRDQFTSIDRLNKGISGLVDELEASGDLEDTTILLMSEFGRTLDVNGTNGTDHGEGGVYYVINSGPTFTKGGQLMHESWTWPTSYDTGNGWSHAAGRYYTPDETDYRQIYAEIMLDFMGADVAQLNTFFGETYDTSAGRYFFKRPLEGGVSPPPRVVRQGFPGLFV